MAKKYHQSRRDRRDESVGMDKRLHDNDSGMIKEDHSCIANLPQEVMMKEYPKFMYGLDPYLNDTQSGIDSQIYDDMKQMKRHKSKTKY